MTRSDDLDRLLTNNKNELPAYAWPGGYPILYMTPDNNILCAACATKAYLDPEEFESFKPYTFFINYEGPIIYCEECNEEQESAYGDPSEEDQTL